MAPNTLSWNNWNGPEEMRKKAIAEKGGHKKKLSRHFKNKREKKGMNLIFFLETYLIIDEIIRMSTNQINWKDLLQYGKT